MHYDNLDPHARYKVRIVYAGESFDVEVKLSARFASSPSSAATGAEQEIEIHPFQSETAAGGAGGVRRSPEATAGGELTLQLAIEPRARRPRTRMPDRRSLAVTS